MRIELKNKNAFAAIDTKGAELKSYRVGERELMWSGDEKYWGKTSPFLFPMIGNLREGKTRIDGKEYAIGKHGFARDNEFALLSSGETEAVFSFSANEETKKCFPFDFTVTLSYRLAPDALEILYDVKNRGETNMHYCIGAHPAFAVEGEFDRARLEFAENETVFSPIMNLETRLWGDRDRVKRLENERVFPLSYPLFDRDCVYFDTLRSKRCSLIFESGRGVSVSWAGFETLGVWTPDHKNAPFLCIEPWCGCDDYDTDGGDFAKKRGIQTAAPGETKTYKLLIEAI
ncbi:MAG: aldose 1-epimerase family protein [Bacteroides sp.]|nr:aldose 1-epimerase family protein [Eubacterium sp.]MCM1417426.1 aldose 1-epimerase family protein [Roseburia sp.]MCM1461605.1 aldose 1-epimerase family protein [Bacteroides sp.]